MDDTQIQTRKIGASKKLECVLKDTCLNKKKMLKKFVKSDIRTQQKYKKKTEKHENERKRVVKKKLNLK